MFFFFLLSLFFSFMYLINLLIPLFFCSLTCRFTGTRPRFDILFPSEWYTANDDRGRNSPWPLHVFFVYVDLNVTVSYLHPFQYD